MLCQAGGSAHAVLFPFKGEQLIVAKFNAFPLDAGERHSQVGGVTAEDPDVGGLQRLLSSQLGPPAHKGAELPEWLGSQCFWGQLGSALAPSRP